MVVVSEALKERVRALVDELPEGELPAARRYLEYLRDLGADPVLRSLREAPLDDEEETAEEAAAVQEGRDAAAAGERLTTDEVRRELDL